MACVYGYAKVLVFTRTASTHVGDICEVIFQKCQIPRRELGSVIKLRSKMFLIQTTHYNAVRIQTTVCIKGWQFFMSNGDNHIRPAIPDIPDDDSPLKPLHNVIYVQLICPEELLRSRSSDDGAQGKLKSNDEIGQEIVTKAKHSKGVIK